MSLCPIPAKKIHYSQNKSKIRKTCSGKHTLFFIFEQPELYQYIADTKTYQYAEFELRVYIIHRVSAKFEKPV